MAVFIAYGPFTLDCPNGQRLFAPIAYFTPENRGSQIYTTVRRPIPFTGVAPAIGLRAKPRGCKRTNRVYQLVARRSAWNWSQRTAPPV